MIWNWWVLALIIPCWIVQNTLHELAHLVSAWFWEKLKPKGLWPLWHWRNLDHPDEWRWWRSWELWKKPWPKSAFFFARFRADPPRVPRRARHTTFIAPVYAATAVFSLCAVMALFGPPSVRIFFVPQAVCCLVDAGNWWRGFFWGRPTSDGKRWRYGDV